MTRPSRGTRRARAAVALPLCSCVLASTLASCRGESSTSARAPAPTPDQAPPPPSPARTVAIEDIELPLPDGYEDRSADFRDDGPAASIVLDATQLRLGYRPSIVVQKVLPGGSFADPATCRATGEGLIRGGTLGGGMAGTLLGATIVDGPTGKACQIRAEADVSAMFTAEELAGRVEGTPTVVVLLTELHRPGNTVLTPQEVWLMTCNHARGDAVAEATCASTLAGFRFTR